MKAVTKAPTAGRNKVIKVDGANGERVSFRGRWVAEGHVADEAAWPYWVALLDDGRVFYMDEQNLPNTRRAEFFPNPSTFLRAGSVTRDAREHFAQATGRVMPGRRTPR